MKTYHKQTADILTLEQLRELLGIDDYDSLEDCNSDGIYDRALWQYAYDNDCEYDQRKHTLTKDCPHCDGLGYLEDTLDNECFACAGSGTIELNISEITQTESFYDSDNKVRGELYEAWLRAFENTAERALEDFDLEMTGCRLRLPYEADGKTRYYFTPAYKITAKNWKRTATEITVTIQGYGKWYDTALELLQSGPYSSYKACVLDNLEYIANRASVYGSRSIKSRMSDNLNHYLYAW